MDGYPDNRPAYPILPLLSKDEVHHKACPTRTHNIRLCCRGAPTCHTGISIRTVLRARHLLVEIVPRTPAARLVSNSFYWRLPTLTWILSNGWGINQPTMILDFFVGCSLV